MSQHCWLKEPRHPPYPPGPPTAVGMSPPHSSPEEPLPKAHRCVLVQTPAGVGFREILLIWPKDHLVAPPKVPSWPACFAQLKKTQCTGIRFTSKKLL